MGIIKSALKFVAGLVLVGIGIATGNPAIAFGGLNIFAQSFTELPQRHVAAVSNPLSTQEFNPIAYGSPKGVGWRMLDRRVDTNSEEDRVLYLVGDLCVGSRAGAPNAGAIAGIDAIYFDHEEAVQADGTKTAAFKWKQRTLGGTLPVDTITYVGKHLGSTTQAVDSQLNAKFPTVYTSTARGRGIARLVLALWFQPSVYNLGSPPQVNVDLRGRVCWDPRLGPSSNTANWAYTENNALCLLDFLLDQRFGGKKSESEIDIASFEAGADWCDEQVSEARDGGSPVMVPRFRCNGLLDTSRPWIQNADELRRSMGPQAELVPQGGVWRLVIRKDDGTSGFGTIHLDESVILGDPDFSVHLPGITERFNRGVARYVNVDGTAPQVLEETWPAIDDSTYLDQDNGADSKLELEMPLTQHAFGYHQVRRALRVGVRESRMAPIGCAITCNEAALTLQVGDIVEVSHGSTGWDRKPFRIRGVFLGVPTGPDDDNAIRLVIQEYQPTAYSDSETDAVPPFVPTEHIDERNIPDPTSVNATSDYIEGEDGTILNRIIVDYVRAAHPKLRHTEILAKKQGDSAWNTMARVPWYEGDQDTGAQQATFDAHTLGKGGDVIDVLVYSVSLGGFYSDGVTDQVTIGGKTTGSDAPTNVTVQLLENGDFLVDWDAPPEADHSYYAVRDGTDWPTANVLPGGERLDTTEFRLPLAKQTKRTYRFMIAPFNRSGILGSTFTTTNQSNAQPSVAGLTIQKESTNRTVTVAVGGWQSSGARDFWLHADTNPGFTPTDSNVVDQVPAKFPIFGGLFGEPDALIFQFQAKAGWADGATIYMVLGMADELTGPLEESPVYSSEFWVVLGGPVGGVTTGAPQNNPTTPTFASEIDGELNRWITLGWAYTQGDPQADSFVIYRRASMSAPTGASDEVFDVRPAGERLFRFRAPNDSVSSYAIRARRVADGIEYLGDLITPAEWTGKAQITLHLGPSVPAGGPSGPTADEWGPGGKLAFDGMDEVAGVPNLKGTSRIDGFVVADAKDGAKRAKNSLSAGSDTAPRFNRTRHASALLAANRVSSPQNYTPPLLLAEDVGASARITVAAFTLRAGSDGLGYGGGTINGLSFSTTYHVYVDDAEMNGEATPTYQATTSENTIVSSENRVYVGTVKTPFSGGGSTDEDDGGGTGGGCVAAESWVDSDRRAIEIVAGDPLDVVDGEERVVRAVWAAGPIRRRPCVRLVSETGATLIVSFDTPITLWDGRSIEAGEVDGHELYVVDEAGARWESTVARPVGVREIVPISLGGSSFLAGERRSRRIATHNAQKLPQP